MGDAAFDWRASQVIDGATSADKKDCTQSLFIEPVQWMENVVWQLEGKV